MTEEEDDNVDGRMKVQRRRRRVYEAQPGKHDTADATPVPQPLQLSAEKDGGAVVPAVQRTAVAIKIIKDYSMWSAGVCLIPVPVLDMVALTALELKMLKSLSLNYGMKFPEQKARAIVTSLLGGFHGGLIAGSILKLVPFFGTSLMALTPVASGAITYAVGMVFVQHFESGGNLLNFDIVLGRERLKKELGSRKDIAAGV